MKDYLVHAEDHTEEITAKTWNEAVKEATWFKKFSFDDITIDQYEDNELTGVYWTYNGNKLVKH